MLAESGKFSEMEEKIRKVRGKHKQNEKMWLEVAKTYYMLQKFEEARNLKVACLKSIQNKKTRKYTSNMINMACVFNITTKKLQGLSRSGRVFDFPLRFIHHLGNKIF